MIKKFIEYLGLQTRASAATNSQPDTDSIRKIIASLEALEPGRARYLALFASILSRVARADLNISDTEAQAIEQRLQTLGGLDAAQAVLVTEIAKNQNVLLGGVENYLITREFANRSNHEQRFTLLEALFAVAAAEEGISAEENQEIKKIADEIGLTHHDFLAVRAKFKTDLNVLKGIPKA